MFAILALDLDWILGARILLYIQYPFAFSFSCHGAAMVLGADESAR
jgi:hypothetical protein